MATKDKVEEIEYIIPSSLIVSDNVDISLNHSTTNIDQRKVPATKREVWSYYAYYAANNGIGSFQ